MIILLLLGVFLAWTISRRIYDIFWDKNLYVKVSFKDSYIYEGDESALTEIITNNKRLPLPALAVRLAVNKNLKFLKSASENSSTSDQTYKKDVFSFLQRQRITRTIPFVGTKRGLYKINSVDIVGCNFFFQETEYVTLPQDSFMYVFPEQINTSRISLVCKEISGMLLSQQKLQPDPFEFSGIRDYCKTDPINHINWKASARMGNLMVNQFDSTTSISPIIILDIEDSQILKHENLVEKNISITSSLAGNMISRKMSLSVRSNGIDADTSQALNFSATEGKNNVSLLNRKLACLSSEDLASDFNTYMDKIISDNTGNKIYIILSHNYNDNFLKQLQKLTKNNSSVLWIVPRDSFSSEVRINYPNIRVLNWEVGL